MITMHLDIETYSGADLTECGLYKYAEHPDFRVLLLCYALDDGPVECIDVEEQGGIPEHVLCLLSDPEVVKVAHNASFERVCLSHVVFGSKSGQWLDPAQWECTMVLSSRCGLPLSLKDVGAELGFEQQKMSEGKDLIKLFCMPNKSRKGLPAHRVHPGDDLASWEIFKAYCVRDVEVERQIWNALSWHYASYTEEARAMEHRMYALDQRINDYGVLVDRRMAEAAVGIDAVLKARLSTEAVALTGLANPNSVTQLKMWLSERLGIELNSLSKDDLADLTKLAEGDEACSRVLQIRAEMRKTSIDKYSSMLTSCCDDGRCHGLLQFCGTRTGRWAGRLVQMQNLPQNHIDSLDDARELLREGDEESIALAYGNVSDVMSQLIRTAFVAPEGSTFCVCDFSAIEARVLAWLAGEEWVLDVFRNNGDIYCATASQMFHVPVEKHGPNAHLRQKGKVAVLALGYQGGKGSLDSMGGARLGMTDEEELETVRKWREANRNIVALWGKLEEAARNTILYGCRSVLDLPYTSLSFEMEGTTLTCMLPSGRLLCWAEAQVPKTWKPKGKVNRPVIDGVQQEFQVYTKGAGSRLCYRRRHPKTGKREILETYGGEITENITQAVARDILAYVMTRVPYPIVFHVHDELVMEVPEAGADEALRSVTEIFSQGPEWAKGLPLKGAGFISKFYKKD